MPDRQFRPATLFMHGLYETLLQYMIFLSEHNHNSPPKPISYTQTRGQFCIMALMSPRRAQDYFQWLEDIGAVTVFASQNRLVIDRKACQDQLNLLRSRYGGFERKGAWKFDGRKLPEIKRQRLVRKARKGEHPEDPDAFKPDDTP